MFSLRRRIRLAWRNATRERERGFDGAPANVVNGTSKEVACGGSLEVRVSPATYTVSESAGVGTSLADYETTINGACDSAGRVTLSYGDSKTCTVTNKRKPVLTVTKACPNGKQSLGDRFEVVLNGTRTGRILDCGQSTTF